MIPWLYELSWEASDATKDGKPAEIAPARLMALIAIAEAAQKFHLAQDEPALSVRSAELAILSAFREAERVT